MTFTPKIKDRRIKGEMEMKKEKLGSGRKKKMVEAWLIQPAVGYAVERMDICISNWGMNLLGKPGTRGRKRGANKRGGGCPGEIHEVCRIWLGKSFLLGKAMAKNGLGKMGRRRIFQRGGKGRKGGD